MKFKETFPRFLLIAVLAVIIYSNSFSASWHFDDYSSILENYKVKNLVTYLTDIFSNPRCVCDFTFAVNYYFNRTDVFGFHVINLITHIVSAFMVYLLIGFTLNIIDEKSVNKNSFQFKNLPLIGSLIFVAHPIQTQAVTYIVQRYTSLATMFYLMALVLFIKARMNLLQRNVNFFSKYHFPFYLCSFLCAFLAMRTKEIAVTIPFIFLLYDFIFLRKTKKCLKKTLFYILPFLFLVLIILTLRVFIASQDFSGLGEAVERSFSETEHLSRNEYAITQISVILTYIRLLFFPVNQNISHVYPVSNSIFTNYTYLSLIVHILILALAVLMFRVSRLVSFGIFWFYITVSVESSIIPIRDVIFEHRVYLPSVGFVIFLIGIISLKTEWKNIFYIFFAIIISMLSITTYNRNSVWQDDMTLWSSSIKVNKNNPRAYFFLGNFYRGEKLYDKSIEKYKMALMIDPDFTEAHIHLGNLFKKKGLLNFAISEYKEAIRIKPNYAEAYINMGNAYKEKGMYDLSEIEYKNALNIKPDYPRGYYALGNLYAKNGFLNKSIACYRKAIDLDKNFYEAYNKLGSLYADMGKLDESISVLKRVIKFDPYNTVAYNNLATVYAQEGRFGDAIINLKKALEINPELLGTRFNLGLAYYSRGEKKAAIDEFKKILKINPSYKRVKEKIGKLEKEVKE